MPRGGQGMEGEAMVMLVMLVCWCCGWFAGGERDQPIVSNGDASHRLKIFHLKPARLRRKHVCAKTTPYSHGISSSFPSHSWLQ
ncbi:hypothetical protein V8C44DRAFT_323128 [Trichoderma aethiopicum]